MIKTQKAFKTAAAAAKKKDVKPNYKRSRDCPRVTVRLSQNDYEKLQALANGLSLSVYMRAKALDQDLPIRRKGATAAIQDRAALSRALGLLGQSRIANNLNQLAYHANVGSLQMDEIANGQIDEAYYHVRLIRQLLIRALGLKA